MNYAPRLRFSYEKIASWVSRVAMASEKVIVYEHDENPDNIHCHMLVMGFTKDVTTLKNWFKEALCMKPRRVEWTFPQTYKDQDGNEQPVNEEFVTYMSKGVHDPKYNKGFSPEFVAERKTKGYAKTNKKISSGRSPQCGAAAQYYDNFVRWLHEKSNHKQMPVLDSYDTVKKYAWSYMMQTYPMPMPYQMSLYKASLVRYCWDYSLPLPDKVEKQLGI